MTANICPPAKLHFHDASGNPLSGGKVYFYTTGGSYSTPKDTYTTSAASVANANPVILNARGEATVYLVGDYDMKVTDSSDVLIYSQPNINTGNDASTITFTPAGGNAVETNVQAKLRERLSVLDYGAAGDGATDDTTAIQNAINYLTANGGGTLFFPAGTYLFNVTIKSYVTIQGEGKAVTKFTPYTDAPVFTTDATVNTTEIGFEKFRIAGDVTKTSSDGIVLKASHTSQRYVDNVHIRDADIQNCGRYGLHLYGDNSTSFVQNFLADNVNIDGCNQEGLRCDGWVIESSFRHGFITQNGGTAGTYPSASFNVGSVDSNTVGRWRFERVGFSSAGVGGDAESGICVDLNHAKHMTFDNCQFELGNPFIDMNGSGTLQVAIRNCNFESVYSIGNFINIDDCQGFTGINNHFTVSAGKTADYCFYASGYPGVNDTAAFRIEGNTYPTGSLLDNQAAYYETHTNVDEVNNVLHVSHPLHTVQTAADTNADINSLHDRQGTTGSNEFDPNQLLVLRGNTDTSRSTLKHGTGNIQLAGGVDFVMADKDDVITLMWDHKEKVWRELSRSYAFMSATTAQLAAQSAAVNTDNKFAGRMIWNTTTTAPVWAEGSGVADVWNDATGATAHTPV